ncbi:SHOCT domain-containing protein [Arcobacter sp. KX21116]|jgi:putative membrane protein|uniref:SHOCT domain-containing protein n=1 Tax=Arcobacter iocasae TaxID=2906515 RepID=UPI0035D3DF6B|tara:strand:- start:81958 stop:82179 length:222 start_codon:yes stop_codon:yes gene_type:complete
MFGFMNMNMTLFHGFGMLIFWAIIVFLIFSIFSNKDTKSENDTPLDILKKKFARGDISEEEYKSRKKILEENE